MPLEAGPAPAGPPPDGASPAGAAAPSGAPAGALRDEDYDLGSLLDLSHLQAMADHLYAAGGIPVGILSPRGEILVGAGWQEICVKFHRAHPESAKRCVESDGYIASRLGRASTSPTSAATISGT